MVKQQEMETSLYFLNVCGENRYLSTSLWPIMLFRSGRTGGKQKGQILMHGRMHPSFQRVVRWRWWPVLALGTLHSTWDAGGFTICTVEAQLCFVERTCLWKTVELERLRFLMRHRYCHWIQISEETPSRLNTLLNDTTHADFNTETGNAMKMSHSCRT